MPDPVVRLERFAYRASVFFRNPFYWFRLGIVFPGFRVNNLMFSRRHIAVSVQVALLFGCYREPANLIFRGRYIVRVAPSPKVRSVAEQIFRTLRAQSHAARKEGRKKGIWIT
jgi:hypothetical protein